MGSRKQSPTQKVQSKTASNDSSPLNATQLKRLYSTMLRCRLVDEHLQRAFRLSKSSSRYRTAIGHEAINVGATAGLLPEDMLSTHPQALIAHVAKGTSFRSLYAQLQAEGSNSDGPGLFAECGPQANFIPLIPSTAQCEIDTGVALAYRQQKNRNVVVTLTGNGSGTKKLCAETLTFAGSHKLPIVYVVANCLRTEPARSELQTQRYGFPTITVDGNDVVAVYRVCYEARDRARQGYGPTLVDCRIGNQNGLSSSGSQKHQSIAQRKCGEFQDPILHMEGYLRVRGLWSDEWRQQIMADISSEIADAVDFRNGDRGHDGPPPRRGSRT